MIAGREPYVQPPVRRHRGAMERQLPLDRPAPSAPAPGAAPATSAGTAAPTAPARPAIPPPSPPGVRARTRPAPYATRQRRQAPSIR
ncbi:hypothetical protein SGLAM104S_04665 [Streptomyces glaucescens]